MAYAQLLVFTSHAPKICTAPWPNFQLIIPCYLMHQGTCLLLTKRITNIILQKETARLDAWNSCPGQFSSSFQLPILLYSMPAEDNQHLLLLFYNKLQCPSSIKKTSTAKATIYCVNDIDRMDKLDFWMEREKNIARQGNKNSVPVLVCQPVSASAYAWKL